ncbi:MAG: hypothetical protein J1D88_06495 [Treponema sp.]|nr:hypothetical protein [Treponema sp.]
MRRLSSAKGILVFYAFDALLLLVFLLSFLPMFRRGAVRREKSALLNPRFVSSVQEISIAGRGTDGESGLRVNLTRADSVWTGTDSLSGFSQRWPCDMQTVSNLLETASRLVDLYTKGSGPKQWNDFSVDDENALSLTFCGGNGDVLSKLFFGQEDPVTGRIAVRTWTKDTVYETDAAIAPFLTAVPSFWCDPFVFPQVVTGLSRSEAERTLRRGKLEAISGPNLALPPARTFFDDFGNGAAATLFVHEAPAEAESPDESVLVEAAFAPPLSCTAAEQEAIRAVRYWYRISRWTYESLASMHGNGV